MVMSMVKYDTVMKIKQKSFRDLSTLDTDSEQGLQSTDKAGQHSTPWTKDSTQNSFSWQAYDAL